MTKLRIASGLCVALLLACCAVAGASDARETPLVRAVKRAKTSVVNIHSQKTATGESALFSSAKGRKVNGMGTGILIDPRGYIVTNHHVVLGVDSLRVTTCDGSTYQAQIVSFDRKYDLAIIKIDASQPLEVMPLGTSSDLMLGETVIAVGNAYGYEHTVTSGIISALSRDVEVNEEQSYENLIQTDASINPGNSGGPLLNLDGEVVGINVAIRAGAQRIGFAIPIDDARQIIARLLSIEQLNHTYHGLQAHDVKASAHSQFVVQSSQPGSPAAAAGFVAGDIVLKAGDVAVADGTDFERALLGRAVGEKVPVVVRRGSETANLELVIGRSTNLAVSSEATTTVVSANNEQSIAEKTWEKLGLRLARLADAQQYVAGTRYNGGMQVQAVRTGGPAALSGIRQGDILVGLHIWETVKQDDVSYVLDNPDVADSESLKFYILRGGETLYGNMRLALAR
jgi:serine protease Do